MIIDLVRRLVNYLRGPNDRVAIDLDAVYRESERREQARATFRRELDLEQRRTSMQVGSWATVTVSQRTRADTPPRMRREILEWLAGLTAQEVFNLSKVGRERIRAHIYAGVLIAGVRRVQPLPPCSLNFPAPVSPVQDLRERDGSGGIRPKRGFGR
ncbi:hypothetical protein H8A95_09140 [Bradyrhizobium sp. Pear76]|uniref:hypothetical protein n=1 Tax=Bradyrhizobium oropedii TaxID=1571201 RepID=UPI001E2E68E2|nr:hypothetical protein [Bradyrhizobium oropedii]MCC8962473.1 hypothetical protein [Bradyrhizobium oropedii]